MRTLPQRRIVLLLYVDCMIVTIDDTAGITDTQIYFHHQFQLKDLGPSTHFLGLEIAQGERGILIS